MSKSIGNVVAPEQVIKRFGADVLRLWVASTDYRAEIAVSDEILQRAADAYRRLRNTARFLLANLDAFDPAVDQVSLEDMLALDRWVVAHAHDMQQDIIQDYNQYQFHQIYHRLQRFCTTDLGGFYLDVIKDRQYTLQADSLARRSAQTAMYHLLEALVRWFAPILTFTAEEIWQHMPGERADSVLLMQWYQGLQPMPSGHAMGNGFWQQLMAVRDAVNKQIETQRNQGALGSALEAEVYLYCEGALFDALQSIGEELRFVLITSAATVLSAAARTSDAAAVETSVPGLWVSLQASRHQKCERCWHRRADVGKDPAHVSICQRCVDNIAGVGEVRQYA